MRTIPALALVMLVALALSATYASTASAEGKFLAKGAAIVNPIAAEAVGEISLTDLTPIGEATVDCSVILDGKIVFGGADFELETLLNLPKEAISTTPLTGLALSCEGLGICANELAEVWPDNLPWLLEVELMTIGGENLYLYKLRENGKGEPGYHVICKTAIGNSEDLCIGNLTGFLVNEVVDVSWLLSLTEQEANGEQLLCTVTNGKTGHAEGALTITSLELLSISE
jgi:hypothetical protein